MYDYTKAHRLNKADEFSSVFIFRKVKYAKYFKIHFKPNQLTNSRLGIIVGKKIHKKANRRNYMKRFIREVFRREQLQWESYDLVVRVQLVFTADNYVEALAEFQKLTQILCKQKEIS